MNGIFPIWTETVSMGTGLTGRGDSLRLTFSVEAGFIQITLGSIFRRSSKINPAAFFIDGQQIHNVVIPRGQFGNLTAVPADPVQVFPAAALG